MGRIAVGLSVSGPAARISSEVVQHKLPRLLEIARQASADLGFVGCTEAGSARSVCVAVYQAPDIPQTNL